MKPNQTRRTSIPAPRPAPAAPAAKAHAAAAPAADETAETSRADAPPHPLEAQHAKLLAQHGEIEKTLERTTTESARHREQRDLWKSRHEQLEKAHTARDAEVARMREVCEGVKTLRKELERVDHVRLTSPTWLHVLALLDGK